jgi:tetratricopeptide (TPR) repeat protein
VTSEANTDDRVGDAIALARVYIDSRNYARARNLLRQNLAQSPNDPALLAEYARTELLLKNYDVAAQSAYAALAAAAQDEVAMRIYALALDGVGRRQDALLMAYRTIIAHPNAALAHWVYARLLHDAKSFPSALQVVDESLRLNSTNVDALVLRGAILEKMGRIRESGESYREALALDPDNAGALNNLAVNRLRRGKLKAAMQGFLGAAGLDPTLGNLARRNVGLVLRKFLRWANLLIALLGFQVLVAAGSLNVKSSTVVSRVITGLLTVALIGVLVRMLRGIPRPQRASVLRNRRFIVFRILHASLAVIVGTWATIFPAPVALIALGGLFLICGSIAIRVFLSIQR